MSDLRRTASSSIMKSGIVSIWTADLKSITCKATALAGENWQSEVYVQSRNGVPLIDAVFVFVAANQWHEAHFLCFELDKLSFWIELLVRPWKAKAIHNACVVPFQWRRVPWIGSHRCPVSSFQWQPTETYNNILRAKNNIKRTRCHQLGADLAIWWVASELNSVDRVVCPDLVL